MYSFDCILSRMDNLSSIWCLNFCLWKFCVQWKIVRLTVEINKRKKKTHKHFSYMFLKKKLSVSIINHDFSCNKTMFHSSYANIKQFANYLTSTPHKFVPVPAMELFFHHNPIHRWIEPQKPYAYALPSKARFMNGTWTGPVIINRASNLGVQYSDGHHHQCINPCHVYCRG